MVVNRWARSASRSLMAEQGRGDCLQEQDWLSFGIQVKINNLPGTGCVSGQPLLQGMNDRFGAAVYTKFRIDVFEVAAYRLGADK